MRFGKFLNLYRTEKNVTLDGLCEGLCSVGMLARIERDDRRAEKLLRDQLLARLGISNDEYETYLDCVDYEEWELRQKIVHALDHRESGLAERLLKQYKNQYCIELEGSNRVVPEEQEQIWLAEEERKGRLSDRLRWQFYYSMRGMCLKLLKASAEELFDAFEAALRLTVPEIDRKSVADMVLSCQELNLVLEYIDWKNRCCEYLGVNEDRFFAQKGNLENRNSGTWNPATKYQEVIDCLNQPVIEDNNKAKVYSKAVYYLCRELSFHEGKDIEEYSRILILCNSGITLLRKTERTYYLWELLMLREQTASGLVKLWMEKGQEKRAAALEGLLVETREWKLALEALYDEFGILREQAVDCWLYYEQDTYCIGDVIRIRRKMLGMTRGELCQGICSLDTLRRLENGQKKTQRDIVTQLCRRLRLPEENERTELATDSIEAHNLEREIRYAENEYRFGEVVEKLERVKQVVDMSEPVNQQWVQVQESIAKFGHGEINHEQHAQCSREALEITVPIDAIVGYSQGTCYLTNEEMLCLYRLALSKGINAPEGAYQELMPVYQILQAFEEKGTEKNHIRSYELEMFYVARLLCAMGKYEEAEAHFVKIIKACLHIGRINATYIVFSELLRNRYLATEETDYKQAKAVRVAKVKVCHTFSQFCKSSIYEEYFTQLLIDLNYERN